MSNDGELIRRGDAMRAVGEYLADVGSELEIWDIDQIIAAIPAAPVSVRVKPEGPQFRELKTCKGCVHFKSEYWREPSGDGETYDSGTSADCLKSGRSISTYNGSEPTSPEWCPVAALDVQPAPDAMAERVAALMEAAEGMIAEYLSWKPVGENHHFEPEEEVSVLRLRATLAAMKGE